MKKKTVKVLAVLMCIMTAVAFMPTFAFAAEAEDQAEPAAEQATEQQLEQPEELAVTEESNEIPKMAVQEVAEGSIKVTVSISKKGELVVLQEKVTVTDNNTNGKFDIDDVLRCAHQEYYKEGAATGDVAPGYSSYNHDQYGLSLGKLWGDDSGNFGYYVNNKGARSLADEVKDGDSVYAFVYKDTYWSDRFSFFDRTEAALAEKEEITLNLQTLGYDENWNTVIKPYINAIITIDGEEKSYKTGADGNVTIAFPEAGTYKVSAVGAEGDILVPPVCVVTVYEDNKDIVENQYQYVVAKKKEECISKLNGIDIKAYRSAQQINVLVAEIVGIADVNLAETVSGVEAAFDKAMASIGSIKTDAQMTKEEKAVQAIGISSFSVKAGKKRATVKWAKNSTFSGYQIYYKQAKKGAKYTTTTATSKTIKSLKKKKKYTFKVRGYKKMNGKTIYGKWSSSKTIKIK